MIREWHNVKVSHGIIVSFAILSMLQDSLIQFLHLAHTGIKGAAFLPGGEPASGADVGEEYVASR